MIPRHHSAHGGRLYVRRCLRKMVAPKYLIGTLAFLAICLFMENLLIYHKIHFLQELPEGLGSDGGGTLRLEGKAVVRVPEQLLPPNASFANVRRRFSDELWESVFYRVDVEQVYRSAAEGGPMSGLSDYRNPCWMAELRGGATTAGVFGAPRVDRVLRCVPYVYLVGVTKSGTSDLYNNMIIHPDMIGGTTKEPNWWNRKTAGRQFPTSFEEYVSMFDRAASAIQKPSSHGANQSLYHAKITIDGTPGYLWDYDGWQTIPANRGLPEPRYTLAHTLRQLTPQARIIVLLRQPAERLYSHFRMLTARSSSSNVTFHTQCEEAVKRMRRCLRDRTLRSCAYDATINPHEVDGLYLRASLYYVFVQDWLQVFPRDQVLVIRAEDYYANRSQTLRGIWDFLNLPPVSSDFLSYLNKGKIANAARRYKLGATLVSPMLPETKIFLADFFMPYNRLLARLLNDEKYLWKDMMGSLKAQVT